MFSIRSKKTIVSKKEQGFSLIELVIVVLIICIMSVITILSFKGEKKYLADDTAYKILDILNEARQRSLTQHETMRVEFNRTRNTVRLISENEPNNANDDKEIKNLKLEDAAYVIVGTTPQNVYTAPAESSPIPILTYNQSVYPLSQTDTVATLRFVRTGAVLNAGSNAAGDNAAMTGATIYIWSPDYSQNDQPLATGNVIRAITVQGTSGLSRFVKCPVVNSRCENWIQ